MEGEPRGEHNVLKIAYVGSGFVNFGGAAGEKCLQWQIVNVASIQNYNQLTSLYRVTKLAQVWRDNELGTFRGTTHV